MYHRLVRSTAQRLLLALVLVGLASAARGTRLVAVESHRGAQRYEDVYYLPMAHLLPLLSLGYRDALAVLIWCKSLVYFGEEIGHEGEVQHVFDYTDAVLALDPDFRSAYRWVATAAIYRPVAVSIDSGLRAAGYLERAVKRWPHDGELRWDYGSLLRFELAPLETDPARKRALLEKAAPHLEAAARMGAGPPWLAINSVDLMNKLGRTEQAIRHLEELRHTVRDPQVKSEIEERLQGLRAQTYAEAARSAEAQFERTWQSSYPYLSPGLFLFVGERMLGEASGASAAGAWPRVDAGSGAPSGRAEQD